MPRRVARSSSSDNHAVISWIMLRFRPIAPKPVGGEATSGSADQQRGNLIGRRTKRKYVRVRGRKQCTVVRRMRKKAANKKPSPPDNSDVEDASPPEKEVVTLQLLPERSETSTSDGQKVEEYNHNRNAPVERCNTGAGEVLKRMETVELMRSGGGSVIQTWIIVECVTDKCVMDGVGLGFSWDAERMYDLEQETCPGLVSDGENKVIWVNEAYKRMVGAGEVAAGLVVKEELPDNGSFACRVRVVVEERQREKWRNKVVVACDVWRLQVQGFFAGFAWKLDVNTALTLSL